MQRRTFLAMTGAALVASRVRASTVPAPEQPRFTTQDAAWQAAYDAALSVLVANVQTLPYVSAPVLIEGSQYRGIWQECGPMEALIYRKFRPDVARNSHLTFFELQRADGQLAANNKVTETSFGQIQMVVPIAATAWELARDTGDGELLERAYRACVAWDGWLMRYRNTRGTGLIEGFCTYDTGHDNSPRWAGIPDQCPNKDARRFPPIATLPRLCPDLSATVFGARRALAAMAGALGRPAEATMWEERAETIRTALMNRLYAAEDGAFYDLDARDQFVRVRGDVISRVVGEHVVDQQTFETIWARQLHNPTAFWAPYPLPSIALDDPHYVASLPPNSWGGAAQALTALRAGRWFDHYGKSAAFGEMMDAWCNALIRDSAMRQQIDPRTGRFTQGTDQPGYSPAALVMIDYSWRLIGVVEESNRLVWNVRPAHRAAKGATLSTPIAGNRSATMTYTSSAASGIVAGKAVWRLNGGPARIITGKDGRVHSIESISDKPQRLTLSLAGAPGRHIMLAPGATIRL